MMTPARFKRIRKLLGETQAALARRLRCNPRTVRRYEAPEHQKSHRAVPRRVAEDMERWLVEKTLRG